MFWLYCDRLVLTQCRGEDVFVCFYYWKRWQDLEGRWTVTNITPQRRNHFLELENLQDFFVICDTVPVLLAYTDQRISSKENLILFQYSVWKNVFFYFMLIFQLWNSCFFAIVKFRFEKKDVQTWFSSTPTLPVKTFHLWAAFDNLEGLQALQVIRDLCQALDWGFFWNTFHCSLKHPQRSHYFIFYFIFFSKQHKS